MSVLFSYAVSEAVRDRYLENQKYRSHRGVDHLAISDCELPDNHIDIGKQDGPFCLSRYRNAAIDCAIDGNYDLLIIGDADSVFLAQTLNQDTIFSTALVCHLNQGDSPTEISNDEGRILQFRPCSWFVIHRSIFTKYRFDENYRGFGYEDIEFNRRLKRNGITQGPLSLLAFHMWHQVSFTPDDLHRNRRLYEST